MPTLSASLSTSAGGRSIPERPPRLGQGHEVPPLDPGAPSLAGLGPRLLELDLEPGQLGLQGQDSLDPGQVEALGGEVLDAAEELDVLLAVPAVAAVGAGR